MLNLTEAEIMASWAATKPVSVSVCCITYRQEQYIAQAIDSFLMQKTTFPFEIIIGEDCGGDGTLAILAEYQARYPSLIKIITSKQNIGANANLLRVCETAQGEFIATCEGDDYWSDKNKLQIQYDLMTENEQVSLSYHPAYVLRGMEKSLEYVKSTSFHSAKDVIANPMGMWAPTASYMFKREVISELPEWFSQAPIGDYFIEIYAMKIGGGLYIDHPMCIYRCMASSSWSESINKDLESFIKNREEMISYNILSKDDFPEYAELIEYRNARLLVALARECILKRDFIRCSKYIAGITDSPMPADLKRTRYIYKRLKSHPEIIELLIRGINRLRYYKRKINYSISHALR